MFNRFEVHCHTDYSNERLYDAINKIEDIVDRAIMLGLSGLAITDHGTVAGHIRANKYQDKIQEKYPDFKIALGEEGYLVDERAKGIKYYHCIWIAKDKIGQKQIRKISSLAWLNTYSDHMERVPILKSEFEEIIKEDPGHIIVTTACLGGEVSSSILEMEYARMIGDTLTAEKAKQRIVDFILWAKNLLGNDFYLEIAPAASEEQIIVNKKMAELSQIFNVKMVIGCDAHYGSIEDRSIHKAFLESDPKNKGNREVDTFYEYSYLQSEEEIIKNLTPSVVDLYEQLCLNSMEIWSKIENYSLYHPQQIPKVMVKDYNKTNASQDMHKKYPTLASMIESDDVIERYWVNECINKINELFNENDKIVSYYNRLEEEADIKRTISEKLDTNFFAYPVVLQHYINMFWDCGSTVGAGRGSSCSGLNHYLLGVTQIDPIKYDLPFWRYSNKERIELGDIDIDIAPSKRPKILREIKRERGKDFIESIDMLSRENLGCTLIATFGTQTSKSAILTACRGYRTEDYPDGIDNDIAQYMSSLVPIDRGFVWPLKDLYYGNDEKDRKPVMTFVNEVNNYPGLFDIMLGIEGLISHRGTHASGVILFDEDPYEFGAFMKSPGGDVCTQYDLHDAEYAGMTKYDFLVTSVQDKITKTIELLQKDNLIDPSLSLKQVYDKYLHPMVIPIDDEKTWESIKNVDVLDLFQFDSVIGAQAAKKIKPSSIFELSDANGLMRLMTAEKGAETPMDKYVRFKNNINLWYEEMDKAGLTKKEQKILEPHFLRSYGVPPSQEQMMTMLMDENICNFSLKEANDARKIVGKKQMSKIPELKEKVLTKAKRTELGKYVWTYGIGPQMGYSFSIIHALAYSFIAYQTAYLASKWNPIYWDTACLIVNSESLENTDEDNDKKEKGASYNKIAKALGNIKSKGVKVSLININTSDYEYKPDVKNNRILYGLKALSGINSDIIEKIIAGRPYVSIKDFMKRCPLNKTTMISLIKSGAFDEIDDTLDNNRFKIMAYYIMNNCDAKKRITLQNFKMLISKNLVPKDLELQVRIFNFNSYLKMNKIKTYYYLDSSSLEFFQRFLPQYIDSIQVIEGKPLISQSAWEKIYKSQMEPARQWTKDCQEEVMELLNTALFQETWTKYAKGNLSKWEIESVCFYDHPHELINVNKNLYGISDFIDLPETPIVDSFWRRGKNQIPIYRLTRIIGTVIAKDDNRSMITLLTTTGVVDVKFTRDYYGMFKKQISEIGADGKKHVIEKSWFKRGEKLMITGFRRDDQFVAKTYSNTEGHQLYKITDVINDKILLQHERLTSSNMIEEEDIEE